MPVKAYLVVDLTVLDAETFQKYCQKIPFYIEQHKGRYLVKGAEPEKIEGAWVPQRMVILEFPTDQNARDFIKDPEVNTVFALRHASTKSNMVLVAGCD